MRDHLQPNVWELPREATAGDPASAAAIVLTTVVLAVVLIVAMTSARRLGALIVLVAVGPGFASDLVDVVTARSDPSLFVTLVGWLTLVGQGTILVIAATWWRSAPHPPAPERRMQPVSHH